VNFHGFDFDAFDAFVDFTKAHALVTASNMGRDERGGE